jgi:hypothetical protein
VYNERFAAQFGDTYDGGVRSSRTQDCSGDVAEMVPVEMGGKLEQLESDLLAAAKKVVAVYGINRRQLGLLYQCLTPKPSS